MLWIPSPRAPRNYGLLPQAVPDFFRDSLPASCGALAPFRLCSCSQPQSSPWDLTSEARASAPRHHPPHQVSRQASQAGECWLAPLSVRESLHFALYTLVAALSSVALKLHPHHPLSPPVKGFPSVWKLFLLHSSLPEAQVLSLFFCLCFFFFLLPHQGTWEFLAFWEVWGLLPEFSRCSAGVVPHVDVFLMYLWGGRWSHILLLCHLEGLSQVYIL